MDCSAIWQSKRDKIIKIQTQGCKSTNFAYGRMQKVKIANSRVQKYRAAYGRVQKVKPANSKAVQNHMQLCTFVPLSLNFDNFVTFGLP